MYNLEQIEAMRAAAEGVSMVHPVAMAALVVTSALMLKLPRKQALIPFFAMTMLIPSVQRVSIGTLAFFLFRILIIVGWIRLFVQSEFNFGNKIDKIFGFYVFVRALSVIFLWQSGSSVVTSLAFVLDMLGSYVLIRSLIRDFDDIDRIIKTFLFISIIISVAMCYEHIMQKNLFAFLGGVPEVPMLREDRIRCQGSFQHPILAGCFGAVLFPLFVYLYSKSPGKKTIYIIGVLSTAMIVYTASSSGPLLAYCGAIFALLLYPLRRFMKVLRWTLFLGIIALHFIMKAPVWALIARIDVVGGSTSYHRFTLVDQFIKRVDEWWLVGTKSTAHWSEYLPTWDIANEYVLTGVNGGMLSIILLIIIVSKCFSTIGKGIRKLGDATDKIFLYWMAGVMLFTHLVAFWGVGYFGQFFLMWIFTLSLISTLDDLSNRDDEAEKKILLASK